MVEITIKNNSIEAVRESLGEYIYGEAKNYSDMQVIDALCEFYDTLEEKMRNANQSKYETALIKLPDDVAKAIYDLIESYLQEDLTNNLKKDISWLSAMMSVKRQIGKALKINKEDGNAQQDLYKNAQNRVKQTQFAQNIPKQKEKELEEDTQEFGNIEEDSVDISSAMQQQLSDEPIETAKEDIEEVEDISEDAYEYEEDLGFNAVNLDEEVDLY